MKDETEMSLPEMVAAIHFGVSSLDDNERLAVILSVISVAFDDPKDTLIRMYVAYSKSEDNLKASRDRILGSSTIN